MSVLRVVRVTGLIPGPMLKTFFLRKSSNSRFCQTNLSEDFSKKQKSAKIALEK